MSEDHVPGGTIPPGATDGARRTREQRTSDSRQRILDAAVACLVESGYARTTTLTIQARAGVSRGRLLHHFPSKEMLLVAAAQHLASSRFADEGLAAADLPDGPEERIDRAVEAMWATFAQPYFWAAVELWTAARTDPALAAALRPAERRLGAAIRRSVDAVLATAASPTGADRVELAREQLLTSMRGVALTYGFDPREAATDPHLEQWKRLARLLLR